MTKELYQHIMGDDRCFYFLVVLINGKINKSSSFFQSGKPISLDTAQFANMTVHYFESKRHSVTL